MIKYIDKNKGSNLCDICDADPVECYWFRPLNLYLCGVCLKRELKHRGIDNSKDIFKEEME